MSENKKNRRHRPNKNKQASAGSTSNNAPANPNNAGGNRRRNTQSKNRRPKSLSPVRILQKYDNLLDQHIVARRKFYEMHGRIQGKQLEKVESNFERTLRDLRSFEKGLKDWQKDVLEKKVNIYPEDRFYSTTNELPVEGERVDFVGEFEDPHLLATQKSENWQEDTEESVGSMDDYYQYKGVEPPVKS